VTQVREGWDDDQLLAALGEALKARWAVPEEFVQFGKDAYAWHNVDAELAQLSYDSVVEAGRGAGLRSETASIRAMTFTSARLTIELEVTPDALIGQVLPPRDGTIEAQSRHGGTTAVPIDRIGCFAVEPLPPGPFRLHCRLPDGPDVLTGWITL
jgi:hypothetical protein